MTLSFWIRDYVFTPLYKAIAERWPRAATTAVYPCYFVAFFLAGVWHGSTFNWVIFGMLHGAGVSAAKLWETFLTRRWGRKGFKEYLQNRAIRIAAIAATLNFICFTFVFFTPDMQRKWTIAKAIWNAWIHGGTT
jgi:D-alanyl-lipoteichoic acid acyltransferase DltB (MBOAT superfamily)